MGLSTHVLNTSTGQPAAGVRVTLAKLGDGGWVDLRSVETDADGRCSALSDKSGAMERGTYRVRFETGRYFADQGQCCLYPYVEIAFEVSDDRHLHVPLLLSANGYTTYRGS